MQNDLPTNIPDLQKMVMELSLEKEGVEAEIGRYEQEINLLREQIRLLKQKLFGRKSEKYEEAGEALAVLFPEWGEPLPGAAEKKKEEVVEVAAHTRKKTGRKPLPEDLPRVVVEHDLPESEKICGCGCVMSRIGEESSEQLDIIPAKYQVIRHVRYKYACKKCEGVESESGAVKIASAPEQMIPKSIASSRLLAHIFVGKFCDSLPFYRQENQFMRAGIEISRANMCNWAVGVYNRCQPLLELLKKEVLSGPLINLDETTVQVLEEPEREAKDKSYMWVSRGGPPDRPVFYFHYDPSRSGEVAEKLLSGYRGYVQTDGYPGYDFLDKWPGVIHVGCWAHVRRNFMEVIQAAGGRRKNGKADETLAVIRKLYQIEKEIREMKPEEIVAVRQEKSKPILDEFGEWLKMNALQTLPKSLLGKAFNYAVKEWPRLVRYLEDGRLRMDNNLAENAIRPFVVGRKNWLFSGTPEGAQASAFFYSIIETAKANGLDPFDYLVHLFDRLPLAKDEGRLHRLLPPYIEKAGIAPYARKK